MLGPLPRVVAPFRDETITSYLHRLAGPNHIDPARLRFLLTRSTARTRRCRSAGSPPPPGCPTSRWPTPCRRSAPRPSWPACISRTVPAPATAGRSPPAGPAWPASRSPGGRCTTTSSATGTAAGSAKTASSPTSPGSRRSCTHHRRHRRLIRRHGRDPVMRALRDAQRICTGWRLDGLRDPGFDRRMEIFCGPGWHEPYQWAPQAFDAAPTRRLSPWPGCSPARTGASASSARAGPGTTNSPPSYAAPSPPTTPGTIARTPAGAAAATTRCSNGD